jgi:hypothetical protein
MHIAASARIAFAVLGFATAVRPVEAQEKVVHVPISVLERYVGEYVYPAGNTVRIILRGHTLYRESSGQLLAFVPISETLFKAGPVFTAEFVIDKAGGVTQIVSDGIATEFRLPRKLSGAVAPATPTPVPAAVRVPKSVLERYTGEYEFMPGQMGRTDISIVVRLRRDTLTRQITYQPEIVLTPISETRFRVGSTSLTVEFAIDESGGVTQVLGTGSQQMKARRKAKTLIVTYVLLKKNFR